jgi:hypothetical protein
VSYEGHGLISSKGDPEIYVFDKDGELYILALYVDDNIIACLAGNLIIDVKEVFGSKFNMIDMGSVSWLLGTTLDRYRTIRVIKIGQRIGQC